MQIELTPDKSILITPLKIVVLEVFNPLLYNFALNKWVIKNFTTLEELNKC